MNTYTADGGHPSESLRSSYMFGTGAHLERAKSCYLFFFFLQCRFTSTETVRTVRDWAPQLHPLLIFHTDGLNCRMCDECTWHHKTFRMKLHWHLAIIIDVLYCRCIHPQTPTFCGFYTRSGIMQMKVRAHLVAA